MLHLLNPIPADKIRLIVFDLDGTLIDSRKDLTNSINAMLAELTQADYLRVWKDWHLPPSDMAITKK